MPYVPSLLADDKTSQTAIGMEWCLEESCKQCGTPKEHHQACLANLCGTNTLFFPICSSILYSKVPPAHLFGSGKA